MSHLVPLISPEQACEWLLQQDATLIDVRDDASYHHLHIAGSMHLPARALAGTDVPAFLHERVILACDSGKRSTNVYHTLQRRLAQLPDVMVTLYVLEGGLAAWQESGLPVIHNTTRRFSLDRQLSLILGLSLVTGTLFSMIFFWLWLIVPFGIGALLIYKGLTGAHQVYPWLLSLPWNKTSASAGTSSE